MITIRPANHTDFDAVADMMRDFIAKHHSWQSDEFRPAPIGFTGAIFQTWLDKLNELHLVADADGRTAGYAAASRWVGEGSILTHAHRGVFIFYLMVAANKRRRGIGRALFGAVEDWATAFRAEHIGLHVVAQNEAAKAFYSAMGYESVGEHRSKTLRRITRFSSTS